MTVFSVLTMSRGMYIDVYSYPFGLKTPSNDEGTLRNANLNKILIFKYFVWHDILK